MATSIITLLKGDKVGTETDYRDYLPVNMSGVVRKILNADGYMLQQPGLTQYGTAVGIDRGGLWNERFLDHYRVSNGKLISVTATGVVVELGDVSGTQTASLPNSFNTQAVITDGRMWLYSPGGGFAEITDPDLGDPIDGVWIDNVYFLTDGDFIYHTDLADETAIDPLKFATAEFMPDTTNGVAKTSDNKVLVFGRYSCEYFVINPANTEFLFQRLPTRALKLGIVGTFCKCEILDQYYVMGGRKEEAVGIHVISVGSAVKVSSREVDKVIGQYTDAQLATSVLEPRVEDDYQYLIVHLPNETLLLNIKLMQAAGVEQAWSILKTDVAGDQPWRAKHGVFDPRLGQWVYGDKLDGRLGVLDETVATHYGAISEWLLNTPFLYLESQSIDSLEIEIVPGHTLTQDGKVFISLTQDGVTHGPESLIEYGQPSQFKQRFIIYKLGYIRNWVGIKLRGASRSRMAFGVAKLNYG